MGVFIVLLEIPRQTISGEFPVKMGKSLAFLISLTERGAGVSKGLIPPYNGGTCTPRPAYPIEVLTIFASFGDNSIGGLQGSGRICFFWILLILVILPFTFF